MCVFLNVGGLGSHGMKLQEILLSYQENHLIFLAETWLKDKIIKGLNIDNYHIYYQNRRIIRRGARRASGGLLCLVRKDILQGISRLNSDSEDVMWIRLSKDYFHIDKDICLGLVYFSPERSTQHIQ